MIENDPSDSTDVAVNTLLNAVQDNQTQAQVRNTLFLVFHLP